MFLSGISDMLTTLSIDFICYVMGQWVQNLKQTYDLECQYLQRNSAETVIDTVGQEVIFQCENQKWNGN